MSSRRSSADNFKGAVFGPHGIEYLIRDRTAGCGVRQSVGGMHDCNRTRATQLSILSGMENK